MNADPPQWPILGHQTLLNSQSQGGEHQPLPPPPHKHLSFPVSVPSFCFLSFSGHLYGPISCENSRPHLPVTMDTRSANEEASGSKDAGVGDVLPPPQAGSSAPFFPHLCPVSPRRRLLLSPPGSLQHQKCPVLQGAAKQDRLGPSLQLPSCGGSSPALKEHGEWGCGCFVFYSPGSVPYLSVPLVAKSSLWQEML